MAFLYVGIHVTPCKSHCNPHCQATEFLDAIKSSPGTIVQLQAMQPGQQPAYLYLCEAAVDVVRRYPSLAQEPSQRCGRRVLSREEGMLGHW